MKRFYYLMLCLLVCEAHMSAQVYEAGALQGTGQIMRVVGQTGDRVIYIDRAQGQGTFVLATDSTVLAFDLPNGLHVKDFEIDGNMVYFCGNAGIDGMVGMFDIRGTFLGGDTISYVVCNSYTTVENYTIHLANFSKMDINKTATGTGLALVGEGNIDPQYNYSRTIPTAVRFVPSGWEFIYYYNKDGVIHYTDIACLDNVVTAAGYLESDPTKCVVRSFRQTLDFPAYILGGTHGYQSVPVKMYRKPHIVRIKPDAAAVVHLLDDNSTAVHQLFVDYITGLISAIQPIFVTGAPLTIPQSQCLVHEIRYSDNTSSLWILENDDPVGNNICENALLCMPMHSPNPAVDVYLLKYERQVTLDINSVLHDITTGGYDINNSMELLYYKTVINPNIQCETLRNIAAFPVAPVFEEVPSNPDSPHCIYPLQGVEVKVVSYNSTIICQ